MKFLADFTVARHRKYEQRCYLSLSLSLSLALYIYTISLDVGEYSDALCRSHNLDPFCRTIIWNGGPFTFEE